MTHGMVKTICIYRLSAANHLHRCAVHRLNGNWFIFNKLKI